VGAGICLAGASGFAASDCNISDFDGSDFGVSDFVVSEFIVSDFGGPAFAGSGAAGIFAAASGEVFGPASGFAPVLAWCAIVSDVGGVIPLEGDGAAGSPVGGFADAAGAAAATCAGARAAFAVGGNSGGLSPCWNATSMT
jgi:hypothetical protein